MSEPTLIETTFVPASRYLFRCGCQFTMCHSDTIFAVGNRLAGVMHRLVNMVCFDPTVLESCQLEYTIKCRL
jgi:hypothetical protein